MTIIEIVLSIVAVLGLALAYQAKHNGVTIAAQAKTDLADAKTTAATDLAAAKAEATTLVHDLEGRVIAVETKLGLIKSVTVTIPPAAASGAPAAS